MNKQQNGIEVMFLCSKFYNITKTGYNLLHSKKYSFLENENLFDCPEEQIIPKLSSK